MSKKYLKLVVDNININEVDMLKEIVSNNFNGLVEIMPLTDSDFSITYLEDILDSSLELIVFAIDINYNYVYFNKVHDEVMKNVYASKVKVGSNLLDAITIEGDRNKSKQNFDVALHGINHKTLQTYGDKGNVFYETIYSPIYDENDNVIGATAFSSDVSNRVNTEKKLKISEQRYSTIFEQSPIGIALIDSKTGNFIDINDKYAEICQRSKDELKHLSWISITHPDDIALDLDNMKKLNNGTIDKFVMNKRYITPNNKIIWVNMKVNKLGYLNDRQTHLAMIEDITLMVKNQEKIEHLSNHDYLTDLKNRRYFERKIKELDTTSNLPITIILGDVNGLKLINDSLGYEIGDELLINVGNIMKESLSNNELVARIGGDEFAIVIPNCTKTKAEKTIKNLELKTKDLDLNGVNVSVSFGFSIKESSKASITKTIKDAEENMHKVKLYENKSYRSNIINMISKTLFEKNPRESSHSQRVGLISEKMGTYLNLPQEEINRLRISGFMHDIGKIGVPEQILNKKGVLKNKEYDQIKKHPEIGYRILCSSTDFFDIASNILEHHERWDGTGYPKGIKEEEISLQARILAIADSFDAMTTVRTYGKSYTFEEAKKEITRCAGTQFDPFLAKLFVENYAE